MAQAGIWYDGRFEQWDSYIEMMARQARDDRRSAGSRRMRQAEAVERKYEDVLKRDFE